MAWIVALQWAEEELSLNNASCSLAISFGSVMVVPIFPFRYCLRGQMFLPHIFLTPSHTCFIGVSADSFDTDSAHDWHFFWLKSRRAFACDLLKADMVSPLSYRLCRTLLSKARLAFRASRHSSSNQGFDFLGMVVALGMQSVIVKQKQTQSNQHRRCHIEIDANFATYAYTKQTSVTFGCWGWFTATKSFRFCSCRENKRVFYWLHNHRELFQCGEQCFCSTSCTGLWMNPTLCGSHVHS